MQQAQASLTLMGPSPRATLSLSPLLFLPLLLLIPAVASDRQSASDTASFLRNSTADTATSPTDARRLQHTCPNDNSLVRDGVWYEIDTVLLSKEDVHCSDSEWLDIRRYVEDELKVAPLYNDFKVTDLNPHICDDHPNNEDHRVRRRLAVVNDENGQIVQYIHNDDDDDDNNNNNNNSPTVAIDEMNDRWWYKELQDAAVAESGRNVDFTNSTTNGQSVNQQRKLEAHSSISFIFHLFYRGGGKCWFCRADNADANSRRDLSLSSTTTNTKSGAPSTVRGAASTSSTPKKNDTSSRRKLGACGGCHYIDFDTDGNGNPITGTPYLDTHEWYDSAGLTVRAKPVDGYGYAPGQKARIYDSTKPVPTKFDGSIDLASPNNSCGGPGSGWGGKIGLRGENCVGEKNVLIIQESNSNVAKGLWKGGELLFNFRYPVTLNSVGFMNLRSHHSNLLILHREDGLVHKHWAAGYGANSLETMQFDIDKVKTFTAKLDFRGAIRYLDFCHDCGEEEEETEREIEDYYPSPSDQDFENTDTVAEFISKIPQIQENLSALMGSKLKQKYGNKAGHCLNGMNPTMNVFLKASTPGPANDCDAR